MATKRNDSKGYERGARGIDGKDGEGFDKANVSMDAMTAMYGRTWSHTGLKGGLSDITSPDGVTASGGGKSTKELQKSAVGGQRKLGS